MTASAPHVLIVGDPGTSTEELSRPGSLASLSWLGLVPVVAPRLAGDGAAAFQVIRALHRGAERRTWIDLARGLADQVPVDVLWHLGPDLAEIASDVADDLGVPLVGGPAQVGDASGDGSQDYTVTVTLARVRGRTRVLVLTEAEQIPGTPVLFEHGPWSGAHPERLGEFAAIQVPDTFFGSVDLAVGNDGPRWLASRPWQPGDAAGALLRASGIDPEPLACAVVAGGPLPRSVVTGPVATAAYGSTAAGTLIQVDGLEAARSVPGVSAVQVVPQPGSRVLPWPAGPLLVRATAVGTSTHEARDRALAALARTAPVVDVVPSVSGALEQRWF